MTTDLALRSIPITEPVRPAPRAAGMERADGAVPPPAAPSALP